MLILGQEALRQFWMGDPANTRQGKIVDDLFMFILWANILPFVILMGLMVYFVVKYRRRPGVPTLRSPAHNTALELTWSVIPLLVMVVIFFWGFHGYAERFVTPAGAEEIKITGLQWQWNAEYSNGASPRDEKIIGVTPSPIIVVPANRPVKFLLTSSDVIHSFYIPAFRGKIDVFPNRATSMWFHPMEAGMEHVVYCAEYCGKNHSEMAAWIKVLPEDEFQEVKAKWAGPDPEWGPVQRGYFYYKKYCRSCHNVDSTANTGPPWDQIYNTTRTFTDGTSRDVKTIEDLNNYLTESVYNPNVKIVEGYKPGMNSFKGLVPQPQVDDIAQYIRWLATDGKGVPKGDPSGTPGL